MITLHYHPIASYCWKALIALYETETPFEPVIVDLADAKSREAFLALWPTGMMPLLVDDGKVVPESSIIVEHIAGAKMLGVGLEARLWDRLFDGYLTNPVQAIVADHFMPGNPQAMDNARAKLAMAYGMADTRMKGRTWAAGEAFGMAECAAFPALFYARTLIPFGENQHDLAAYFERMVARPSVARCIEQAKPYLHMYPFSKAIEARFLA